MANTPCTFAWYVASLVLEWIEGEGGVAAMAERNERKAERLYRAIDASSLYANRIEPGARSRMNVSFELADAALDSAFLEAAAEAGFIGLKGHRALGGMRASIYNAMPEAGIERLVAFLEGFERSSRLMFRIRVLDDIAQAGLDRFPSDRYRTGPEIERPDAICCAPQISVRTRFPTACRRWPGPGWGSTTSPSPA